MSKAEKFIEEHTRNYSNIMEGYYPNGIQQYYPWVPLRNAREAVKIAREEITERALIAFQVVCNRPAKLFPNCEAYCNACKHFKQAMKDE